MKAGSFGVFALMLMVLLIHPADAIGQEQALIQLLNPQKDIGKPLMQALNDRKSSREFSKDKLTEQDLSNLLWAGFGINRPQSGKHTAPSAVNWQEIDIYVSTKEGLYRYNPTAHGLIPVLSKDIREQTGHQPFVKIAPVNLIYVADFSRMGTSDPNEKVIYSAADTGFISQNVYLYCASQGLATIVRGLVNKETLAKTMKLKPDQHIILAQSVGYPIR